MIYRCNRSNHANRKRKGKMGLRAKAAGDFAQVSVGLHPAYCYGIVDIGHQDGAYGVHEQVVLMFEVTDEHVEIKGEEEPMILASFYTLSLSKRANLRKDLEGWRGRPFTEQELEGFDLPVVLGQGCTLDVRHDDNGKARIRGITGKMKGMHMPPMRNTPVLFNLDEHGEDSPEFYALPEWLQKIIGKRVEPGSASRQQAVAVVEPEFDDDIPFSFEAA